MNGTERVRGVTGALLTFRDLLFISFGGQAPFISLLTFGTVMIIEAGVLAPFAMMMVTFTVLLNGLVVYYLSRRFKRGGGYYTYALYSLTPRLGLNTGWSYILYSLAYGGTLLSGGAYVLYQSLMVIHHYYPWFSIPTIFTQHWLLALITSTLAAALVLSGVRVSARYAEVMSIAEITALIALSLFFLHDSGWKFYNPLPLSISQITPNLLAAVVFGLGIPTGYGSIAPLGYDARLTDIGKAAISVLLMGGLLASFFLYSLGALFFTGNLVSYLLSRFGLIGSLTLAFIALNDGILGGMAYILANSRNIRAMSEDRFLPGVLSMKWRGRAILSEALAAALFIGVIVILSHILGLYLTFITLGALAGLNNLFIHISANASLMRVSLRRIKKHAYELLVGLIATLVSIIVFAYSLPSFNKYIVYMFLGWIILGFLYAEILEIMGELETEIHK
ncbi:MAG: APC family permease [Caldivirga sp.]|uniref:APC family permease n=1 Tax=Caldivirga sp. TaxID=2080243 RepID=UPI003D1235BE